MTSTRSPRPVGVLLHGFVALAVALGLIAPGASAQAASAPSAPKRPCGHYALVLQDDTSVDLHDLNGDGWHCSGPTVSADNKLIPRPKRATKHFAGRVESLSRPWLSAKPQRNRYTVTVSAPDGGGPIATTFRYDKHDRFFLNYGNDSATGGSRRVTLNAFERGLTAAAASPYFHLISLDVFYSHKSARSSVFSLYTEPDESPAINDVATLRSGKVTDEGHIKVSLNLTCPEQDSFMASMVTLTIGSGAPDDIVSSNRDSETTGTCTGERQTVKLLLITQPIDGVFYPAPKNCSAEYGVTIDGPAQDDTSPRWTVRFDKGGADGGEDGPGPQLCLQ